MLTFILLIGFLSIVFIPMLCMFYTESKLIKDDAKKVLFWLSFLTGVCVFILYGVLKPKDPPVTSSKECGVVQSYQVHKTRGGEFERIHLRFDGAQYNRHLLFNDALDRPKQGQFVCFEFLDKFKYPHLSESKLVRWIEPVNKIENKKR